MPPFPFKKLIERLKEFYSDDVPVVTRLAARRHDPFLVLIGCLLSLRTKDETTDKAMERLTKTARTPKAILAMPVAEIEKAIYPVGFYRVKARLLQGRFADRHREIRQPRARYARRAADYQGRWAENGQHRYHGGLRHPRRSSRHARTPHLEQAGHRQDQVAGRDRNGSCAGFFRSNTGYHSTRSSSPTGAGHACPSLLSAANARCGIYAAGLA